MIDLHIIQNEKVAVSGITSYRKNFKPDNIPFVIFGGNYNFSFDEFENVTEIKENLIGSRKLLALMRKADRIHVHGIFSFWLLGILATHKKICTKVVWYMWGDDLYCLTKPKSSIKNRMHLAARRAAYKNIRYVSTNVTGDYELLCSLMKKRYEFLKLRFGDSYINGIKPFVDEQYEHDSINILVGNSATESNYHSNVFQKLERFNNENIKVYVPLSYGSKHYADQVIQRGEECFGEKFIPLTDFMPKEDYFKLLMSMDVAIFANDRQQAMGNIVALLYAGKKVYMRSDISSWASLHDEYGIGISDFNTLDNEEYVSFIQIPYEKMEQRKIVEEMVDENKYLEAIRRTLISESKD